MSDKGNKWRPPFRPQIKLNGSQWGVLGILLFAMALEFIFSPYWHPWINDHLRTPTLDAQNKSKDVILIDNEGFIVLAFLLFSVVVILMLTGVLPKAGYAVAALLLLSVGLARVTPITRWIDATTAALAGKAGAPKMDTGVE